ncbi:MAG: dephospho-CoA kinase [Ruminiclostridium sp.]|nr:dephospho-CoA kinase [Ruminiclostridium sp.]
MLYFNDNVYIVGLTGMSGAGKSTAARVFAAEGIAVIDCDRVARTVVEKGRPALRDIAAEFSENVLTHGGELDRKKLGGIVFTDRERLDKLNTLIYPYITYEIILEIRALAEHGARLIVLDAPTLFESGADRLCDTVMSVVGDTAYCGERIMKRDGLTREQAEQRLSSQHGEDFYRERSEFCIENNGAEAELAARVSEIARIVAGRTGEGFEETK